LSAQGDAIEALRREHTANLDQITTMLNGLIDHPDRPPTSSHLSGRRLQPDETDLAEQQPKGAGPAGPGQSPVEIGQTGS
jgi:hypothetical protein